MSQPLQIWSEPSPSHLLSVRSDWLHGTELAFYMLAAALSGGLSLEHAQQAFARISAPCSEVERAMFRGFLSEVLLDVTQFGRSVARRHALDSILKAWDSIRRNADPLSVLRHAVASGEAPPLKSDDLALAARVNELLDLRFAERLRVQDLADELGVSESKVRHCFRLAYGSTVHQQLLTIRVSRGLDLVRQGMKVEAAALAVGFRSKTNFYAAVQRFAGCTPGQARSRTPNPT